MTTVSLLTLFPFGDTALVKEKNKKKTKFRNLPSSYNYDYQRAMVTKNDMSDRYWLSVEPLCSDITKDSAVLLDNMIRECSKQLEVNISERKQHYSEKWSQKILQREQSLSGSKNSVDQFSTEFSRCPEHHCKNHITYSPLKNCVKKALKELKKVPSSNLIKPGLLKKNSICRVFQKNLCQQFSASGHGKYARGDGLIAEIKKSVLQLKFVNEMNLQELFNLKDVATREFQKQEVKETLEKLDEEVNCMYKKIVALKQKQEMNIYGPKYTINKEDAIKARGILKQQEHLYSELKNLTTAVMN